MRRARLGIPAFELCQVAPCAVFKHLKPVLNCAGLAIVTIKIQVHGFGVGFGPDKGAQHANDFRPFFIDRCGVEVVDLLKALWSHWVGKRPLVLSELTATQIDDIPNPFDWGRAHIAGELAVAVYCQPLF